ncbi:MAG TPA: DNA polymerase III subunit delta' [Thermomicrobiales bacterium]|nr:DNA polymerase III subunit delta' [Thermomicrobiales bacterium]
MTIANETTRPAAPAWPVLGQGPVVALLQGAIARGAVAHAYLFAGPPQSGRGTLARLFAQTLNCEAGAPALAPCGACRSCRKIARGVHPDVQVVGLASQGAGGGSRRESKNTSLGIDTIRELQQGLSLRPLEGRWKVAIVEDAETMQEPAANAFLKTLEEPPPFAVLILLVTEGAAVLPTIRSRCQVVEVRTVERAELARALAADHGVPPDDARTLAALARGRAGWALDAAARPDFLAERRTTLDAMLATLEGPPAGLLPLVDRLIDRCRKGRRDEAYAELDAWLGLWRDLLLARSACDELLLNADYTERLRALARRYDLAQLREAVAATGDALRQLDENVSPRLVLEMLALRWTDARG